MCPPCCSGTYKIWSGAGDNYSHSIGSMHDLALLCCIVISAVELPCARSPCCQRVERRQSDFGALLASMCQGTEGWAEAAGRRAGHEIGEAVGSIFGGGESPSPSPPLSLGGLGSGAPTPGGAPGLPSGTGNAPALLILLSAPPCWPQLMHSAKRPTLHRPCRMDSLFAGAFAQLHACSGPGIQLSASKATADRHAKRSSQPQLQVDARRCCAWCSAMLQCWQDNTPC